MAGVEGRFWRWCALVVVVVLTFIVYLAVLQAIGLRGWQHVVAVLIFAVPLRFVVQRFLQKGR